MAMFVQRCGTRSNAEGARQRANVPKGGAGYPGVERVSED
jgi:hypothetical protein